MRVALVRWSAEDAAWAPARMELFCHERFCEIQQAWCDGKVDVLGRFLGPELHRAWAERMQTLVERGCRIRQEGLVVWGASILGVWQSAGAGRDRFMACFDAASRDYIVDAGRTMVSGSRRVKRYREYWTFARGPAGEWFLIQVDQAAGRERMRPVGAGNDAAGWWIPAHSGGIDDFFGWSGSIGSERPAKGQ